MVYKLDYMKFIFVIVVAVFYCFETSAFTCASYLEKTSYSFSELKEEKWFQVFMARNDYHLNKGKKLDQNYKYDHINAQTVVNMTIHTAERMLREPKERLNEDKIYSLYENQKPVIRGFIYYRAIQGLGFSKKEIRYLKDVSDLQGMITQSYLAIGEKNTSRDIALKEKMLIDMIFYKDLIFGFVNLKIL